MSTNGLAGGSGGADAAPATTEDAGASGPADPDAGFVSTEGQDAASIVPTGTDDAGGGAIERTDGATDDASGAADDASADASDVVDAGSSCSATNTPANCSACGVACDTKTGSPSCDGTTCSYSCKAGHSDCNQATAPDTDGCECATPACCGTGCQTSHSDGQGQTFYDCNPADTYSSATAIAACTAFAKGDAGDCSDNWTCSGDSNNYVCFDTTSNVNDCTTCWAYTGPNKGKVVNCECPWSSIASWN